MLNVLLDDRRVVASERAPPVKAMTSPQMKRYEVVHVFVRDPTSKEPCRLEPLYLH